jgi:protein-tyrosine-phosphatase
LFVCSYNSVRSPIAEAILKEYCGTQIYVQSAGISAARSSDAFAVSVIHEIGLDISKHVPRSVKDLDEGHFDLVIAMSKESFEKLSESDRHVDAGKIEYWQIDDVTDVNGSRLHKMSAYRDVRSKIDAKIRTRFANWMQT